MDDELAWAIRGFGDLGSQFMFRPGGKGASSLTGMWQEGQKPFLKFHITDRRRSGLTWSWWAVKGLASLWTEGSGTLELDSSVSDVVPCVSGWSASAGLRVLRCSTGVTDAVRCCRHFLSFFRFALLCSGLVLTCLLGTELCLSSEDETGCNSCASGKH